MVQRLAAFVLTLSFGTANADTIRLVAGGGAGGNGSKATEAKLFQPFGCDFMADGAMVFVEFTGSERLRIVIPDGTVHTLAGNGTKGFSGNGGPGKDATLR